MFVTKRGEPIIRENQIGEIVDAVYRNGSTEILFSDFSFVKIFGDAFKDKGPMQLEVL
jgi:hypothetical protein